MYFSYLETCYTVILIVRDLGMGTSILGGYQKGFLDGAHPARLLSGGYPSSGNTVGVYLEVLSA